MTARVCIAGAALASIALVAASVAGATTGTSQPVSGTAVASLVSIDGSEVDLLIVWRGAPGWFVRSGERSGSGGGSARGKIFINENYGGVRLEAEFDAGTRDLAIAGTHVSLRSANVVLVDGVGSAAGARVVGTLAIDRTMPDEFPRLDPLIARSPELIAFVQCDAAMPDEASRFAADVACARLRGEAGPLPQELGVRMALARYASLVSKMDHAGVASMFAEDGELASPGRAPVRGRAAIETFLRQFDAYKVLEYDITAARTAVDGTRATQSGPYRQRVRGPDGKVAELSGTFTAEWVLVPGAGWRIARMGTHP